MSNVLLILPAFSASLAYTPYPSIHWLAAHCRKHGIGAEYIDLNEGILQWLVSSPFFGELQGELAFFRDRARAGSKAAAQAPKLAAMLRSAEIHKRDATRLLFSLGMVMEYLTNLEPHRPSNFSDHFAGNSHYRFIEAYLQSLLLQMPAPSLVGVSVPFYFLLPSARAVGATIKRLYPDTHVTIGGPVISLLPDSELSELLRGPFSSAVLGEGEETLLELVWSVADSGNGTSVEGVLKPGTRRKGYRLRYLSSLTDSEHLRITAKRSMSGRIPILQSRGCYWRRCAYCDYRILEPRYRVRPSQMIVDDMAYFLRKPGLRYFDLVCSALEPYEAAKIADAILARRLRCTWSAFLRIDSCFTVELLQKMAVSGFVGGIVGLESACDRVLQAVHKGYCLADIRRFLDATRSAKMRHLKINLIVNLPSVTFPEAIATLDLLKEYLDCVGQIAAFPLTVTRASMFGRNPKRYGLTILNASARASSDLVGAVPFEDPLGMTVEQVKQVIDKVHHLNRLLSRTRAFGGALTYVQRRSLLHLFRCRIPPRDDLIVYRRTKSGFPHTTGSSYEVARILPAPWEANMEEFEQTHFRITGMQLKCLETHAGDWVSLEHVHRWFASQGLPHSEARANAKTVMKHLCDNAICDEYEMAPEA